MSRQNMASPISILVAGVVVVVMLLMGSGPQTSATASLQEPTYPPETATAMYLAPTLTAQALTAAATQTGTPGTATPTMTGTPSLTGTVESGTAAPTGPADQFEDTPTVEVLATPTQTPTNTSTATPSNELTCAPGTPLEIAGTGPAGAAYLIYFGERAVGGGTVEADGTFLAKLVMGLERAGVYDVTVRVRGTREVLRELTCTVPNVTPTPIPRERDLP